MLGFLPLGYNATLSQIFLIIMQKQGLTALVFGGTGAIGADLVVELLASPKWARVHCVVRRQLEEWATLPGKEKLTVQVSNDLDNYFKDEHKYQGFSSLFCCFGSQTKHGDETFVKVDKTYPLLAADIALASRIPHYLLVSSMGSDAKSWFLYPRTKGEVEEGLKLKGLNLLSIFKPGLLRNRRDARTVEKIFGIIPFAPGIQAKHCASVLRIAAQKFHEQAQKGKGGVQVFENKDMLRLFEQEKI